MMKSPLLPAQRVAAPIHEPQQHSLPEGQEMESLEGGTLSLEPADAVQRRQIQSAANECPQVQQMKTIQRMAFGSPHVQQMMQLQTAARQFTGAPAQRKRPADQSLSAGPLQRQKGAESTAGGNGGPQNGLPENLRAGVESLSGLDMSDVQVHRNSAKPAAVGALAYAQGSEIHLGPGQEQHLPHEAWHVAQQKQGRVAATRQLKGMALNDDSALEREADIMGAKAAEGLGASGKGLDASGESGNIADQGGGVQLKKRVQLKADVAQAKLTIGTQTIDNDMAEKIDDATEETPYERSGIVMMAYNQTTHFLFRDFAEMKSYHDSRNGLDNMGVWKDVFIRLNPANRYLLGEDHTETPKLDLLEHLHPTNLLYEGDDLIGQDGPTTMDGRENQGLGNGGIDHKQLQELYLISYVISELQAQREMHLYYAKEVFKIMGSLTHASALLNGGQAILEYPNMSGNAQAALLNALAQDFTTIVGTANIDLQGRADPLNNAQMISTSLAGQLGSLQGANNPVQVGAQVNTVFDMRDYIMAGRITRNAPPLIALMGAAHVNGVNNLVGGSKMAFANYKVMLESFKEGGEAFLNVKNTFGPANDIPQPKPKAEVKTEPTTLDADDFQEFPDENADDHFDDFDDFYGTASEKKIENKRAVVENKEEEWDPFGEKKVKVDQKGKVDEDV
jgi:hypothetical protein